jgi:5-methyltetrahydrofolate--homocysteine methyltransferase
MVHVASEMKRRGLKQPLLIGGATTSRMHTALKIAEQYDNGVIHVLDASRSVSVAGSLLNRNKQELLENIKTEYIKLREEFANKKNSKELLSYEKAVANKFKIDWNTTKFTAPTFTGYKRIENIDIETLIDYIDWTPFFIAWEMHGKFPAILQDEVVGKEATKLYEDSTKMLATIAEEKWLTPKAVLGFWPANSNGNDTVHVIDEQQEGEIKLQFLRQQMKKAADQPNLSLADFIAPSECNQQDYLGAFAVTIHGIDTYIQRFEKEHDDYSKIMLQALADRLAEALAEYLHHEVRTKHWGYAGDEALSNEELIREKYIGIRPAPGYPACPDHTEKYKLFNLLNATAEINIQLTESLAMYPASSVCGWYFSHPEAKYFGVGKITKNQMIDYANRKGMPIEEAEKWLRPILD